MKLALGTAQFGLDYGVANKEGRTTELEAQAILRRCRMHGIDTLDTAVAYGTSEGLLGRLGVNEWKVVTKLPPVPNNCDDVTNWVFDQIQKSIVKLGVNQLYGLLLHRPDQLSESMGGELYSALQEAKIRGLTQKIGISVYGFNQLDVLIDNYIPELVQAPVNILDRTLIESGWLKRMFEAGIEVHSRSAFLQGLLLMPSNLRPAKFNSLWSDVWHVWDMWLAQSGLTPLQACMRYVVSLSKISRIVVGVETAEQLDQIVNSIDGSLDGLPEFPVLRDARLINPASWTNL